MEKNKRAKTKYPALKPELNLKTRYELIDYDYIDRLSDTDKKWLNQFTEEYVNANLDRNNLSNNFHNNIELKKDCDRRNNARNRDILTRAKASGNHVSTDELLMNKKSLKINSEYNLFKKISDAGSQLEETSSGPNDNGDDTNNL